MRLDDQINPIIDTLETRAALALGLTADEMYEARETGEASGSAGYVSVSATVLGPMGPCALRVAFTATVGFHLPEVPSERHRITRLRYVSNLWDQLLWTSSNSPNAIQGAGLPMVRDFSVSDPGDPDTGYVMGGLEFYFEASVQKPE